MGKSKSIDRDKLLDVVENIISTKGTSALTVEAVAQAMNISKGGVQSCFKSKQAMLQATAERWEKNYNEIVDQRLEGSNDCIEKIRQHILITATEEDLLARAACHLCALMESNELREWLKDWHTKKIASIQGTSEDERRARIAYLATEGAFFIKYLGLADLDKSQWQSIFSDITDFLK